MLIKFQMKKPLKKQPKKYQQMKTFKCQYSMKLMITLDEFGWRSKISHTFDLDKSPNGIGYDMIIGRDHLNQLDIDMKFSDGTIKWEDQIVPMKNYQGLWK